MSCIIIFIEPGGGGMKTEIAQAEMPYYPISLEEIGTPALILDECGIIKDVNKRFCEILEYSRDEISGKVVKELIEGNQNNVNKISITNNDGGIGKNNLVFIACDKRRIPASILLIPIHKLKNTKKKHLAVINIEPIIKNGEGDMVSISDKIDKLHELLYTVVGKETAPTKINASTLWRNPFLTVSSFSGVEARVAELVASGIPSTEIGDILHISEKTVETHRRTIRKKLGINKKKINLRSFLLSMRE